LLKRGYDVSVLIRKTSNLTNLKSKPVKLIEDDLFNPGAVTKKICEFDYVFHSAGVIKALSKNDFFKHNKVITENLIKILQDKGHNLTRFIYISSLSSLGPSSTPVNEQKNACPITSYGISKLEATKAIVNSGLPYTIFFPPAIYGPRDYSFLFYFRLMRKGIAPVVGSKRNKISVVFVGNLVDAVIEAAENPNGLNECFFVADDGYQTWESFIKLASAIIGVKVKIFTVPTPLALFVGRFLDITSKITGKPSLITYEKVKEFATEWICSTSKIKEKLNYSPKISTEMGLRLTIDWYKTNSYL
ncbi:MAG: NAD-dependent epimerase/dehydratase family protein, partial [bacterium]